MPARGAFILGADLLTARTARAAKPYLLPDGFTAATPNEWLPIWDRVIAPASVKVVGYAAARFAGWTDGASIRPGNAILARICGCSTRTAERSLAEIRDMGLMFRYHKGSHQGDADVYQLTFPDDALTRIPMLSVTWDMPAADTVSGADRESAPDTVSSTPDTVSAAHPTECRPTSTETFPISLQDEGEGFDLAEAEVAHAREVKREMDDPDNFEAERQRQMRALEEIIHAHQEAS